MTILAWSSGFLIQKMHGKKRIQLTETGIEVLEEANLVLMRTEADYEKRLGNEAMAHLKEALGILIDDESGTD